MPIYEYRCEGCGRKFEKLRKAQEADRDIQCPYCECEKTERVLSVFGSTSKGCSAPAGSRFR